jgi:hypothetical protein
MDYRGILEDRLGFIKRFYNTAAEPFETKKRRIEANEEPFVPRHASGEYDGYEYQDEWSEADGCLRVLGHCGLSYVAKALQDYLRAVITREAKVAITEVGKVLPAGKGWLHRYTAFLESNTAFHWENSPVSLAQIEEINLARNVIWHDPSIDGAWPMQSKGDAERFPRPTFGDEMYMAALDTDVVESVNEDGNPLPLRFTVPIHVTREKLAGSIEDVRRFCGFVESQSNMVSSNDCRDGDACD